MKIKNLLVVVLVVAISQFAIACSRDSTHEGAATTSENNLFNVTGGNIVQGVCEYYLVGLEVRSRIEPPNNNGSNAYYEVKNNDNIYIDVIMDVTNLNRESKKADDLLTAKIKIKNNDYTCFPLVVNDYGSDFEKDELIMTQGRKQIHYVAEVPKTEASGKIEIIFTSDGKNFSNEFNLEDIGPTAPIVDNSSEGETVDEDIKSKQDGNEDEYYIAIKKAWQQQNEYINSIDDPTVKQSVQTPEAAAIMECNRLVLEYPEDYEAIDVSLKRVLNGE